VAFGVYVHVPFCAARCGYCDFNTYAPGELGGATPEGYVEAASREAEMAGRVMGATGGVPRADTVFFGGGTPTLLPVTSLARLLDGIRDVWGLAPGAEVTVEANPDSLAPGSLDALAAAGFTRVSVGMQSAVPHVLRTLERTHNPENVARAVGWAREAGLAVSLDLIYGAPGESFDDWRTSVDTAIDLHPDHLSAYALVIEPATRMGAALRRGEIAPVDPDRQADLYEAADEAFSEAGYSWYEVSNWATSDETRCRHNLGYWRGDEWWGIGPGAHSYLGPRADHPPTRWWNVKHPRAYAERLAAGSSPEDGRETLTDEQRHVEAVLLGVRLAEGLDAGALTLDARARLPHLVADGLIEGAATPGRVVLTRRGRLLADAVVRDLT